MEKLQPKLRFSEFKEDWINVTLNDVASKIGDGLHGTPNYVPNSEITFINGNNLIDGEIKTSISSKKVDLSTFLKNDKKLSKNSILISLNGTIGSIAQYKGEKVMLSKSVGYINFLENALLFYHILSTENIQNYFESELTGSTIKNLSLKTLRETKVAIPIDNEEQTKIASFLSAVDDKLNLLKEKKAALEEYKKGMMQKIFSQEIRFKDENGRDFEEWEDKSLGEVGEIITGKTPSTKDSSLWGGNIQFITPTDINESKYQFYSARTIQSNSKLKLLPPKSLLYTCIASIGKMSLSVNPCITNQQINSIIPNKEIDNEFLYYAVLNISDFIKSTPSSSTLPIINKTEFSKFKIYLPCHNEQTKIASFLSAIDEKIVLVSKQIDETQEYKKGLLQQMFC